MPVDNRSRRMMMAAMAALPLNDAVGAADTAINAANAANAADVSNAASAASGKGRPRTLVAYLSRSGNTRVLAGVIHRAEPSDLYEIRTVRAYPDDYFETVEQARQQRDQGDLPALQGPLPSMAQYDKLYLGFPIWGETLPAPVRSFLAQLDLNGKTVVPFITHGGYGVGKSTADLAQRTKGAMLQPPLVMEADQERRTTTEVLQWLGKPVQR